MRQQTAEHLENSLFFTSINNGYRACVVPFVSDHAVSHLHGTHSNLKIGDSVILINVKNEEIQLEASVHQISEPHDIIIFRLRTDQFEYFPRSTSSPYLGNKYKQLGLVDGGPTWMDGVFCHRMLGYYVGSKEGVPGDSACGVFNEFGQFLGVSVGLPLNKTTDNIPETDIISSETILAKARIVGPELQETIRKLMIENDQNEKKCYNCGHRAAFSYEFTDIRSSKSTCYNCQETGQFSRDCPKRGSGKGQRSVGGGGGSCYNCGGRGQYSRDCSSARDDVNRGYGGGRGGGSRSFGGQECYNYGRQGHISRECTESGSAEEKRWYNCQGTGHISRGCPQNN
uniref:CCHC-type domain-containing protein n=1 Tax=Caenorhabditis tropicalis TaxID=1561998 RepID=A0A1I7TPV1_9PELO